MTLASVLCRARSSGSAGSARCSPSHWRPGGTSSSRDRPAPASPRCCGPIAADVGQEVVFVEGNAELTPARLIGQYDPRRCSRAGYVPASFTAGPLLTAMRGGGLLYLEELNRIPEETLNVLITVLAEGEITVPRLGTSGGRPGFRLVAAMNPFDAIGTARVGQAIADRMCRVVLGYQDAAGERAITAAVTGR